MYTLHRLTEKFDLIVANPPKYYSLNPAHPLYRRYKDDLRSNDRQWRIHRDFYASVAPYPGEGASLVISEIGPIPSGYAKQDRGRMQ